MKRTFKAFQIYDGYGLIKMTEDYLNKVDYYKSITYDEIGDIPFFQLYNIVNKLADHLGWEFISYTVYKDEYDETSMPYIEVLKLNEETK